MQDFLTLKTTDVGQLSQIEKANTFFEQTPFSLGLVESTPHRAFIETQDIIAYVSLLRGLFGFKPLIQLYQSDAKAVSALFETPHLITAISTQNQSDGWWLKLMLDKETTPKIFAKTSYFSAKDSMIETYFLTVTQEDVLWENTLVIVETEEAVSKQWLEKNLLTLGMPIKSVFDTIATHTGKCLHLVEVSRSMKNNDPSLSFHTEIEEISVRVVKKVGGYQS
ncbi:MAG: hypothetical protein JXR30_00920 [Alphaproteobacteria bacterium]|nr:hypothetical protein [Alphaproteobacteria bacterium]